MLWDFIKDIFKGESAGNKSIKSSYAAQLFYLIWFTMKFKVG